MLIAVIFKAVRDVWNDAFALRRVMLKRYPGLEAE